MVGLIPCCDASDLGAHGKTYPVVETDLLAHIRAKLGQLDASGALALMQEQFRARVERNARRPPPVAGIVRAGEDRTWLMDPSIVAQRDIADHRGVVFVRAGSRVNPLEFTAFSKELVFIDGDDPEQLAFAQRRLAVGPAKVILTSGDVFDAMRAVGVAAYFDQDGRLTQRFGILAVPATVVQEGLAMRIREWGKL